jgi:hypothetical protein
VLTRIHDGEGKKGSGALAGLLAGASVLARAAGVAVVAAGLAWCVWRKQRTVALLYVAGVVLSAGPWLVWVARHGADSATVDAYNSAAPYASWTIVSSYTWLEKVRVVVLNMLATGLAPIRLAGLPGWAWVILPGALIGLVLLAKGLWSIRTHPAAALAVVYIGMVLLWVWPSFRLLLPLAPLLVWLAWLPLRERLGRLAAPLAGGALAAALLQLGFGAVDAARKGAAWYAPAIAEDWHRVAPLLEWIANETPRDSVVTGNLDPQYYLYARRQAVRAFEAEPYRLYYDAGAGPPLGTVEAFRRRLVSSGVDYLVLTPGFDFAEVPHLRKLVQGLEDERPGSVAPAAGDPASGYAVFRLDRALLSSREPQGLESGTRTVPPDTLTKEK